MLHNPGLWDPSGTQPFGEVPSSVTPHLPTAMNEGHCNRTISVSCSAHDPGQNVTHWDSQMAFGPPRTFRLASSDRQPPPPLVTQESGTLHHVLDQSHVRPSHASSSHATHPYYPHHTPSYQSFNPTSLFPGPHPMPTGFVGASSRSHSLFYRVLERNSIGSSRPRRAAQAIEYEGLWIDKEELLKARMAPDGRLNVHKCRWEEDHSSCDLWIKCDKSSIKAHIQKWHGGTPGGDKSRVDCHWSACSKTMLKESISRHIVNVHLGETWECQGCGKGTTRSDAFGRHAEKSEFDACRTLGPLITHSVGVRVINTCAALENGGRVRYAGA